MLQAGVDGAPLCGRLGVIVADPKHLRRYEFSPPCCTTVVSPVRANFQVHSTQYTSLRFFEVAIPMLGDPDVSVSHDGTQVQCFVPSD